MEDKMKNQNVNDEAEISDEDLEQVAGGAGLKKTVKVVTVDVSDDTRENV